jgi:hypothetical protein
VITDDAGIFRIEGCRNARLLLRKELISAVGR